jgi:hypothetical protein
MFIDAQLLFDDAKSISAAGAITGTNVIDMGVARDIGSGEPMWVVLTFVGVVSGTSPTHITILKGADDAGITSNVVVKFTSGALALPAQAVAGVAVGQYAFRVPAGIPKRYYRLDGTAGGTTPNYVYSASIVKDVELKLHSRQLLSL